jgi:hypothetical protein
VAGYLFTAARKKAFRAAQEKAWAMRRGAALKRGAASARRTAGQMAKESKQTKYYKDVLSSYYTKKELARMSPKKAEDMAQKVLSSGFNREVRLPSNLVKRQQKLQKSGYFGKPDKYGNYKYPSYK